MDGNCIDVMNSIFVSHEIIRFDIIVFDIKQTSDKLKDKLINKQTEF